MNSASIAHRLKNNWKSGVTVSLVSIPLSISLAIAANATPTMGIITALWAGLIAALLGGSNYNIVGPTGALSGLLAAYAITHGYQALPLLALVSGLMILASFLLRLERYIIFIPSSVIHGFTLGVACIIGLSQMNFALGLQNLPTHEKFISNLIESLRNLASADLITALIFLLSTAFLFVWVKFFPKFPGPIILAPIGIALGYLSSTNVLPFSLQTLATKFGGIQAQIWQVPAISMSSMSKNLFITAMAVALIAIIETLLSAKIADGMTKTKFKPRKEMLGLGVANIFSGLSGGIPATAALARTALNIKSGADDRMSALISSFMIGLISLLLLPTFKFLPLAFVAAILVYVAARMVEAQHFTHLLKYDRIAFGLSMLVAIITVVEDPIVGILVGSSASLLFFVNKLSQGQSELTLNKNKEIIARLTPPLVNDQLEKSCADLMVYRFSGQMTYINAQSHVELLRHVPASVETIVLSLRSLFYLDVDGLDYLAEIVQMLEYRKIKVLVSAPGPLILPLLSQEAWFQQKDKSGEVFDHTHEALRSIGCKIPMVSMGQSRTGVKLAKA